MARHTVELPDLVIPNAGTVSNVVEDKLAFDAAVDFIIWGPSALDGTVTVEVAPNQGPSAGDFSPLQVTPGTNVTVAADRAPVIAAAGFKALRLVSGTTETSERTFPFRAQVDMAT